MFLLTVIGDIAFSKMALNKEETLILVIVINNDK